MHDSDPRSHKARVREFFDRDSKRYETERYTNDFKNCHQYSYLARKRHVLDLMKETGGTLLDLGCGPGIYTGELLARGFTIRGVDLSPNMIEIAKRTYREPMGRGLVSFEVGDASSLDYGTGVFDAAICIGVVSYIPNIDDFLSRLGASLKEGGYAVIQLSKRGTLKAFNEAIVLDWLPRVKRFLRRGSAPRGWDFPLIRYRVDTFNALCERYGLEREEDVHFDYTLPVLGTVWPRLNLLIARRLERTRARLPQLLLAGDYLARYRKRSRPGEDRKGAAPTAR